MLPEVVPQERGLNLLAKTPQVLVQGVQTVRGGPGVLSGSEDEPLLSSSLGYYQRLVPHERLGTS